MIVDRPRRPETPVSLPAVLQDVLPDASDCHAALCNAIEEFDLGGLATLSLFLAAAAANTRNFTRFEEDFSERDPHTLLMMFPELDNLSTANRYAGRPILLANRLLGSKFGNGPDESGDGHLYRGRGVVPVRGRSAYLAAGAYFQDRRMASLPEACASPEIACRIGAWRARALIDTFGHVCLPAWLYVGTSLEHFAGLRQRLHERLILIKY